MKQLIITDKQGRGRGQHYHVVYLNDETGVYYVSESNRHTHLVQFNPSTPPQVDQQGNEISPATPPSWVIYPGEDGHTHEFADYEFKAEKKEEENKVVADVIALFREALELEKDSMERAHDAEKFYLGRQWDETEQQRLQAADRAAITLNKLAKHVNELSGVQRQERQDIGFVATEGGDQRVADLLNIVCKVILNDCNYTYEEAEVFMDQVIRGRAAINLSVDFDETLSGKILVERFPSDQIHFGPHDKLDGSDAEYLIKEKIYSRGKLEQLFPDKADEISIDYNYYAAPKEHVQYSIDQYAETGKTPVILADRTMVDIQRREYRVLECWRKTYVQIPIVAHSTERFYFNAFGWKASDLAAIKAMDPGFSVIKKNSTRVRISKVAGSVLLNDENPADLPANEFFCIPVYAIKRNAEFHGVVEAGMDAQKFINKLYSLAIDIGNKMASYGWFYEDETFADKNEERKFDEQANSPGFRVKLNSIDRPPVKVEGTKFPQEIVELMNVAAAALSEQLNISVDSAGANESYSHLLHRQKMRLTGNEYLFDHLTLSKKRVGKLLVALIKRYLVPADIFRIVSVQNQREPVDLAGQPWDSFTEADVQKLFETADLTRYDVEVVETSFSPTARIATFMLLQELMKTGVPIPPDVLLQVAEIPDTIRKKAEAALQAQSQAQAQAGEATANMEIQKTLIAKGIIPPAVAQQQGVPQYSSAPPQQQFQGAGQAYQGELAE